MPIAYSEVRKLVNNTAFQERLQVAVWREASRLLRLQPAPAPALLTWARAQLQGPSQQMVEVTIRASTFGPIFNNGEAATDADLQTAVQTIAPDLAGA